MESWRFWLFMAIIFTESKTQAKPRRTGWFAVPQLITLASATPWPSSGTLTSFFRCCEYLDLQQVSQFQLLHHSCILFDKKNQKDTNSIVRCNRLQKGASSNSKPWGLAKYEAAAPVGSMAASHDRLSEEFVHLGRETRWMAVDPDHRKAGSGWIFIQVLR